MDNIISEFDSLKNSVPASLFLQAQHTPRGNLLMRIWNSHNVLPQGYMYYASGIDFLEYALSLGNNLISIGPQHGASLASA